MDANENAIGPALPNLEKISSEERKGDVRGTKQEEELVAKVKLNGNGNARDHEGDSKSNISSSLLDMSQSQLASLNRYPSPTHDPLKSIIANLRGVPNENWVFLGVGSDEVIDLLFRVTCVPGKDVVITTPPTYGMYKVTANVNDVGVAEVPLITEDGRFEVDEPAVSSRDFVLDQI